MDELVRKYSESRIQITVNDLLTQISELKIQLNEKKCKELRIGFGKSSAEFDPVVVNDIPLEVVPCAKILGLTVSSSLKRNDHIYQTITKARKRLYFLTQLKRAKVATNELVLFYTTCIRPILEYACPVFHDSLPKYLSKDLESIQKRALRVIHPWTPYSDALSLTGLQPLSTRRDNITNKLFQNIVTDKNHKLHKFIPPRNTCVTELRIKHNFNANFQTDCFKNSFFIANSLKF